MYRHPRFVYALPVSDSESDVEPPRKHRHEAATKFDGLFSTWVESGHHQDENCRRKEHRHYLDKFAHGHGPTGHHGHGHHGHDQGHDQGHGQGHSGHGKHEHDHGKHGHGKHGHCKETSDEDWEMAESKQVQRAVSVENYTFTIALPKGADKETTQLGLHANKQLLEITCGEFQLKVGLDDSVSDAIVASMDQGLLVIVVPRGLTRIPIH